MKQIFNILTIAALVALTSSCNSLEEPTSREISFKVNHPSSITKVSETGFDDGDAISLWAAEYDNASVLPLQIGGNFLNNEVLTKTSGVWAASRPVYWSSKACDFYAIYPYQSEVNSIDEDVFSVATNQNGAGYTASDLLWATAKNVSRVDENSKVELDFKHIMSKCVVNVVKGEKFEGEIPDDITVHIYNTVTDCYIDWVEGSVKKSVFARHNTITMLKKSNVLFEAIVVPQNIEKKTPLIEVTMGGIAYLLNYSLSFHPGYEHTINLTLNTSPDQEMIEINIDAEQGENMN